MLSPKVTKSFFENFLFSLKKIGFTEDSLESVKYFLIIFSYALLKIVEIYSTTLKPILSPTDTLSGFSEDF
jgi:hypothetical protein